MKMAGRAFSPETPGVSGEGKKLFGTRKNTEKHGCHRSVFFRVLPCPKMLLPKCFCTELIHNPVKGGGVRSAFQQVLEFLTPATAPLFVAAEARCLLCSVSYPPLLPARSEVGIFGAVTSRETRDPHVGKHRSAILTFAYGARPAPGARRHCPGSGAGRS
jgi:hypothetical protein